MTAPVKRNSLNGSASGASFVVGHVLGVTGNVAEVRLSLGDKVVKIRADLMRAKGASVQAGDTWILDQPYGLGWMFAVPISYPGMDKASQWQSASLLGAWVNTSAVGVWVPGSGRYSPASYYKDALGWVSLRGTVSGGTVTGSSAAGPISADVLQLPVGYRPSTAGQALFPTVSNGAFGAVLVMPDGYVRAYAGSATALNLNGVRFLAEQ